MLIFQRHVEGWLLISQQLPCIYIPRLRVRQYLPFQELVGGVGATGAVGAMGAAGTTGAGGDTGAVGAAGATGAVGDLQELQELFFLPCRRK